MAWSQSYGMHFSEIREQGINLGANRDFNSDSGVWQSKFSFTRDKQSNKPMVSWSIMPF
ncbi:hypothetical protein VIBNISOn1_p0026 [Vibrio nigripulchritudo SOn1]|uniref:Uncharacterized protein n=1 Tax=Vibrio nigripulchritudo SOn1 TaxID=1238450 RepID=A0AAV2VZI6_9VIBR|nr:hypothetical protein VIBNISOn1_p0026 [Vibrio nigripulchritudo SOn1]